MFVISSALFCKSAFVYFSLLIFYNAPSREIVIFFPFVSMCCTSVCNIGFICANVVWYKVTLYCVMLCYYYYMLCLVHIYTVYKANYWWVYTCFFVILDCMWRFYLEFVFRCKRLLAYSLKVMYPKKDNITDVIVIKTDFADLKTATCVLSRSND